MFGLGALLALGKLGVGAVTDWINGRREQAKARAQLKLTVAQARIKAAAEAQHDGMEWRIAAMQASGRGLKWLSFGVWSVPMVWAFSDPADFSTHWAEAMGALPGWYVHGYMAITFAIWGIATGGLHIASLIAAIKGARREREGPGGGR